RGNDRLPALPRLLRRFRVLDDHLLSEVPVVQFGADELPGRLGDMLPAVFPALWSGLAAGDRVVPSANDPADAFGGDANHSERSLCPGASGGLVVGVERGGDLGREPNVSALLAAAPPRAGARGGTRDRRVARVRSDDSAKETGRSLDRGLVAVFVGLGL